jgi:hypothetical protein
VSPHTAALDSREEERIARRFAADATRLLDGAALHAVVDTVEFYRHRRAAVCVKEDHDRRPRRPRGTRPAPAVTRGIRLLELLADAGRPLTLTEIAGGLGLAKSSTANLCLALEAARMIERGAQGYRLGLRTAELGGAFAAQFNQVREFYGVCDASPVLAAELVQVAILDGADALYIARHEGSRAVRSARRSAPAFRRR